MAPDFLRVGQLVHISGPRDEGWLAAERKKLSPDIGERWHIHAYLHEDMPFALAAADMGVMRSGASTLGELPATRLPAVLVPGEYEGWDQSPNARYLEGEGAAVMLPQSRLGELQATVMGLLGDSGRREGMREALGRLARPDAAMSLARLMMQMAESRAKVAV
jgi:UDP-N-acetylglucosamine--N-acetylmuramyl-(pentapeptide) pyrophosphoryl-undecaprenol N-acetylglucosamine transferase